MSKDCLLLTGATGFIGSHVADRLLSDDAHTLVAIIRRGGDYKNVSELKKRGAILLEGSFCDRQLVENIFASYPIKSVIHIAAQRGPGASELDSYYRINVAGTENLLDLSLKHRVDKFIFCSSVGVYGTIPGELPATLETPLRGDNPYHSSKIQAEELVRKYVDRGLNAYIVRPTIAYGQGDNGFPSTFVALVRRRMLLLPFRESRIHLIDVEKLTDVFIKLLSAETGRDRIFIAADASAISCRDLADMIHSHFFGTPYPSYLALPDLIFDLLAGFFSFMKNDKWLLRILLISKSWYYDTAAASAKLAYVPSETKDGFKRFLAHLNHS